MLSATKTFFTNDTRSQPVLTEVICESQNTCLKDQESFKAYLARWMRASAVVAPFIAGTVNDMLEPSIQAAAAACSAQGRNGGIACGEKWYTGDYDGKRGIGMDMNALELWQTLIPRPGPVTAHNGGTSRSDPSAGSQGTGGIIDAPIVDNLIPISTADRAGAAILTILFGSLTLLGGFWVLKEEPYIPPRRLKRISQRNSMGRQTITEKALADLREPEKAMLEKQTEYA